MKVFVLLFITVFLYAFAGQKGGNKANLVIKTTEGNIYIRLDLKKAPVTSMNFLRYVDAGLFDSACFYRVVRMDNQPDNAVKIEVIKGGRYENEENGFPPVQHETTAMTGIRHKSGTVSMARNQPGSATSEFFICIGDQPELDFGGKRNPDRQGFAAFGKVVKGMDVVKQIHSIPAPGQYLQKPVLIYDIVRVRE